MLEYEITAHVLPPGTAKAEVNKSEIVFDATSERDDVLPNPAELLLTSLAACMLKNMQRYSEILHIPYRKARVTIHGRRNDNPPYMSEISYQIEVDTDADKRQIENWHKNILKFGTITNTLKRACNVNGIMEKAIL